MKESRRNLMNVILMFAFIIAIPITSQAQWGKALHFTWWEHDRVTVPDTPLLWPGALDAGTIEMWIKPDSVFKADTHEPDYTYIFCKNISGNNPGDVGMHWIRGQGNLNCFIQTGDPLISSQSINSGEMVFEPRWYHIAYVWDVTDTMRLFIDGKKVSDFEPNEEGELCWSVLTGPQVITIGSGALDHLDDRYETWRGTIDEVRISATSRYKTDFTPSDLPYEVDPYTVALWHFDEGSGLVANDATGFGFNGVLGEPDSVNYAIPEWVDADRNPKIMINEFLADPSADLATGDANGEGVLSATEDEFVELLNVSGNPVDLGGWILGDAASQNFTFPAGYTLQPFEFVVVFGGGDVSGVTGYNSDQMLTKVFTAGGTIGDGLAEAGDHIVLLSTNEVDDAFVAWGTATAEPVVGTVVWDFPEFTSSDAANDNSLTHSPDGSAESEDNFVEHLSVSSLNYSVGMTIDEKSRLVYTLTTLANPANSGIVTLDSLSALKTEFAYGDFVTLTAVAAEGFIFDGWTGDETAKTNPVYMSMTKSKTITANFIPAFQLPVTILINEINADPSTDPIYGDANKDGVRHASQDEYIELVNVSEDSVDMSGWLLGDDEQFSFTFPQGYYLGSGEIVTVYGGGDLSVGPANGWDPDPLKTHAFLSDSSDTDHIGNGLPNAGECVVLISPDTSYAMFCNYASHYGRGAPTSESTKDIYFNMRMETPTLADKNTSITRYPDGTIEVVDAFVQHLTVSPDENSPSLTVAGKTNIFTVSAVGDENGLPSEFALHGNYPNPFNPSTKILFDVPQFAKVSMTITNINGQKIAELFERNYAPGNYEIKWNGVNDNGQQVPSGVYFYTIKSKHFSQTQKMLLLK